MKKNEPLTKKQKIYIFNIIVAIIGLLIGSICANMLNDTQKNELLSYTTNFFSNVSINGIKQDKFFQLSFIENLKPFLIIWICGFSIVSIPITLLTILYKGFIYGFTISFFIKYFGMQGVYFIICSSFPQTIIVLFLLIVLSSVVMDFTLTNYKNKKNHNLSITKKQIFEYILVLIIVVFFVVLASTIETYITPILVGLVI